MKKRHKPRLAKSTLGAVETVPALTGASVLQADHPYHSQFVAWLESRKAELGEVAAEANKRKGRLFLSTHPHLQRCWEGVWLHRQRMQRRRQEKEQKKAA